MIITKRVLTGLIFILALQFQFAFAQDTPKNWFNLDPANDKVEGVSTERAYKELLKGKTSQSVVVAVIDIGVDLKHEDLKDHAWVNTKEIPGNGIDDDHNGYIDDVNGWDFIGGKNGDVNQDNLELTRLYREMKKKYDNVDGSKLSGDDKAGYDKYQKIKTDFEAKFTEAKQQYNFYNSLQDDFIKVKQEIGKDSITSADLDNYKPSDKQASVGKLMLSTLISKGVSSKEVMEEIKEAVNQYKGMLDYNLNLEFDPRYIVGDNYANDTEKYYGNSDSQGPDALHGTHVSGIIGATRNNGIGMDGVAENVKIMAVRVVPNGDERDKDVANGIRYAVDNGAKVINMSFGKGYSHNKKVVDDAVKYAMAHDVLLVHAAGNDGANNDKTDNFPNKKYEDRSGTAAGWIEVGASSYNSTAASFSNYGKKGVDLFAPGVEIYSTIPDNKYRNEQGTSMASPVVAGVATVIRSYFPQLTAAQVRTILMKSVSKIKTKTPMPGNSKKTIKFKKLCVSGGVVNLYNAILLAQKETAK